MPATNLPSARSVDVSGYVPYSDGSIHSNDILGVNESALLSNATASKSGSSSGVGTVDTDVASGRIYFVTTTSSTAPSSTQIKSGQNELGISAISSGNYQVTAVGTQTFNMSSLSASTLYYNYYIQTVGIDSNVPTGASFTTDAVTFIDPNALYVDKAHPSASDANVGSASLPWLTISASTKKLVAGDILYVKAGVYVDDATTNPGTTIQGIGFSNSGTITNRITVERYPLDAIDTVVIQQTVDETGVIPVKFGFYINTENYITIRKFEINGGAVLIMPGGISKGIIFEHMHVHNVWGPAGANVDGIGIRNGSDHEVRHCDIYNIRVGGANQGNADSLLMEQVSNVLIENNNLHGGEQGAYIKYPNSLGVRNAEIRYNKISGVVNGYHLAEFGQSFVDEICHHNLFYNVTAGATVDTPTTSLSSGTRFYNNTIIPTINHFGANDQTGLEMYNNIYGGPPGTTSYSTKETTRLCEIVNTDFNLFRNLKVTLSLYGTNQVDYTTLASLQLSSSHVDMVDVSPEANSLVGDPLFTNESLLDYTLQATSPAKGSASDGDDMGCYTTGVTIGAVRL